MAQIVPASTVAVKVFKDEAKNGQNPKLVNFAKQMQPKIEKHQQMAVQLSQNMGVAQAKKEAPAGQPASGSSQPPAPQPQGAGDHGGPATGPHPGGEK